MNYLESWLSDSDVRKDGIYIEKEMQILRTSSIVYLLSGPHNPPEPCRLSPHHVNEVGTM